MWKCLQSRADKGTPNVLCTACQWKILPGSSADSCLGASLLLLLWKCCFSFEGVKVHICSERETCCYCTKTNRINLTSRGSGAETSLTTAAGPSDYCTPPNQAAFWKRCHFYPGKKHGGESGVPGGIRNRKTKGEYHFFLSFFFFFWVALLRVLCKKNVAKEQNTAERSA